MTDALLLNSKFEQLEPDSRYSDDPLALQCCSLALESIQEGSYGVGALLVDADGQILVKERNGVFSDGFLSSAHAEMRCLDQFERSHPEPKARDQLTLWASLEPCPMCLSRILLSGIGQVKYLLADPEGGMVKRVSKLPPVFRNLATVQHHLLADISEPIRQLVKEISDVGKSDFRKQWRHMTGHEQ